MHSRTAIAAAAVAALAAWPGAGRGAVAGYPAITVPAGYTRGLPVGGDLEYADGVTIAQALLARRDMSEAD